MSLSYFAETVSGTEQLWITDGTIGGTQMVKSFAAGSIIKMTMVGARVYFTVDDGTHGIELWTSDGTTAGTTLVSDINPGSASSSPFDLFSVDGTLVFGANDGTHGFELWRTDGTPAGTTLVKDINPGAPSSLLGVTYATINNTLFFAASDGPDGTELWKSDGTTAGTVMVKDINPGSANSNPQIFTNDNGTLFFMASDGTHGFELWTSDGTTAGTAMVKDIAPGSTGSILNTPFSVVDGIVFFSANDQTNGSQLWRSDGTAAGTAMVKAINPTGSSNPTNLTNVNGTLFFSANDGTDGVELWKSDGTAAGTVMVKDINPGIGGSIFTGNFVNVNGTLFFAANDGSHGFELWKSDGTAAGTVMVKDIFSGSLSSNPVNLKKVNNLVEFYAFDGTTEGLFASDGTAAGTVELAINADSNTPIAFTQPAVANNFNGDRFSDILWRNPSGGLAAWTMNGGSITSSSGFLNSGGTVVNPDASWSVAAISDFDGDRNSDLLWRNTDGTLAEWSIMNGTTIGSAGTLNQGGTAIKPDASWSIVGTGDFDGDSRADILWRNTSGEVSVWTLNGSTILGSGDVTSGGVAVKPDASWSVAGIGDFNGDNKRDVLWRNTSGEVAVWFMNGTTVSGGGDLTSGGAAVKPDSSWSVAGIGDFNGDGNSDVLWRNSNGSLAEWLMNGSNVASSGPITFNGAAVTPDATWHIVEIGDLNGDGSSDILWRNDSGALSEWFMNGTAVVQAVSPTSSGTPVTPDATWSTQAKPANFG